MNTLKITSSEADNIIRKHFNLPESYEVEIMVEDEPTQTHERKQHIIVASSAYDMKTKLDDAYLDDWWVQSVTADGNGWLAVLHKTVKI